MNNNSDPMFDRYADMDFSDAKPVSDVPALAKLQAELPDFKREHKNGRYPQLKA